MSLILVDGFTKMWESVESVTKEDEKLTGLAYILINVPSSNKAVLYTPHANGVMHWQRRRNRDTV